ncbi:MAG: outer membrane beta-barrel protein [Cytophagales bacterium]|nr:outer membrane beta-barrel protein [Cytophagales bacterium]
MGKIVSSVILLLTISSLTEAQSFYSARRERSLIFSGGLGTSTYYGDLANSNAYVKANPNVNAALQYFLSNRIGARVELNWFTLAGDDKDANGGGRVERNLSFQSSNFELSAVGMINLFTHGDRFYRRPEINIYGFAGIGLLYFNPKATDQLGNSVSLQPLKTEGVSYSLVAPVVPVGLGIRFKVSPLFNLSIEAGFRKTFTDYLDDVSTTYPGSGSFNGDAQAIYFSDRRVDPGVNGTAGGIRGNSNNLDSYMLLNAKVEYYLPWAFGGEDRKKYSKKRSSQKKKRR